MDIELWQQNSPEAWFDTEYNADTNTVTVIYDDQLYSDPILKTGGIDITYGFDPKLEDETVLVGEPDTPWSFPINPGFSGEFSPVLHDQYNTLKIYWRGPNNYRKRLGQVRI
ncbi:hypothetical protein ACFQE1_00320 [Halobium palmae]|uniref:Uncharacterized protein n=1 Tax=Halobium palmae TaxID=1776492 RepID=A0ABD5RUB9_9EURY